MSGAKLNLCTVGGAKTAEDIGNILELQLMLLKDDCLCEM